MNACLLMFLYIIYQYIKFTFINKDIQVLVDGSNMKVKQ